MRLRSDSLRVNRSQAQQFEALKHGRYGGVATSFFGGSHGEYHVINYQVLIINSPKVLKVTQIPDPYTHSLKKKEFLFFLLFSIFFFLLFFLFYLFFIFTFLVSFSFLLSFFLFIYFYLFFIFYFVFF
jgi:hypothetical protein